jgi:hypothetical protein
MPMRFGTIQHVPEDMGEYRKSARPDQFKIRGRNIRIPFPRTYALGACVFALAL